MTVTYPLSLPSEKFVRCTVSMIDAVAESRSPFTYQSETQIYDGQMWRANLQIARTTLAADAGKWRAFLANLRGRHGSFLLGDSFGAAPRGAALSSPGTPTVDGSVAAVSSVLPVKGGPTGVTGWLLAGDFLQLGSGSAARLHMVTEDADTDGTGDTSRTIWPATRVAYSDGAALTLTAPKGVFKLSGNIRDVELDLSIGRVLGLTISAEEDLR